MTADQIQTAISYGAKFKTQEKYFQKGLRVKNQVDLVTVGVSSRYVLAFGDWDYIAAQSALAHQLMKPFTPADAKLSGNLHVLVKLYIPGITHSLMQNRYAVEKTNLVFQIGDTLLQPVNHAMVWDAEVSPFEVVASTWLLFHFQIDDPDMLTRSTVATFIDAKGKRNSHKIDLSGLLDPPAL